MPSGADRALLYDRFVTAFAAAAAVTGSLALLVVERAESRRARMLGTWLVLAGVLAVMLAQPFRPSHMGDYADFVPDRHAFLSHFGSSVQFQFQLGGALVHGLDAAFGRTPHSPAQAFDTLARLASFVSVLGLGAFAAWRGYSRRVLRYVAVVLAAPPVLLLFGYHEFGQLPEAMIVWALPLALAGLEEGNAAAVVLGSSALGVGAALHGFGLLAVAFLVFVVAGLYHADADLLVVRLAQVGGAAVTGWLVWIPVYVVGLSWSVVPGHAGARPIRPLFHTRVVASEHRYDYAILSSTGLRDILFEFVILGVVASAVIVGAERGPLWAPVVAATVPLALFVVFFWPIQGLGNDTDFLGSAFPALYGVGWLAARSRRRSLVLAAALVVGQAAMLYVVHGTQFVHAQDF
jgi:hypothetical protein